LISAISKKEKEDEEVSGFKTIYSYGAEGRRVGRTEAGAARSQ
jgi:hypothetical protein